MKSCTAIKIVNKCISYKEKYGNWPLPVNHSDKRNIYYAFKLVNNMKSYEPGDFSFIKNKLKAQALTYDYNLVTKLGAWDVLKNHDTLDDFIDDTYGGIWDIIYENMWRSHNQESARLSLKNLEFISKKGWEEYVKSNN